MYVCAGGWTDVGKQQSCFYGPNFVKVLILFLRILVVIDFFCCKNSLSTFNQTLPGSGESGVLSVHTSHEYQVY